MASICNIVLGFDVEFFDEISGIIQSLYLKYFLQDNTVEILQQSNNKAFLKRIYYPDVQLKDLFIGNSISVFSRVYVIRKFANSATEEFMTSRETHFLIETKSMDLLSIVILLSKSFDMSLGLIRSVSSKDNIEIDGLTFGQNSVLAEFVGVTTSNSELYQEFYVKTEFKIFFQILNRPLKYFHTPTLCIVKPHIVKSQQVGDMLQQILESEFEVKGILSIHLTLSMAEELFDVYRSLVPNYFGLIEQICSGPVIALMIIKRQSNQYNSNNLNTHYSNYYSNSNSNSNSKSNPLSVVEEFRELCGPLYPELAKTLRPKSIRAVFGKSPLLNAVHCTDLTEDGEMECKYIFETLASL